MTPQAMPAMPPPRQPTPAPVPQPAMLRTPPPALDDDILARQTIPPPMTLSNDTEPRIDPYFKQVFDQFVAVKRSCNEPVSGLTYTKFAEKLVKNRDDLMAKTRCREVRFTVYVKDGKAALKATPVKDE
jgi:hypothetical protein